jgi:hypothetical protein
MNKSVNVKSGEVFAIPLFLSEEKDTRSFSRNKFNDEGQAFAYCRIFEDLGGGGILIEVFDLTGTINEETAGVYKSNRLFSLVAVSALESQKNAGKNRIPGRLRQRIRFPIFGNWLGCRRD